MTDRESIHITGAEQYCKYGGYGRSFSFAGANHDETPRDAHNRIACTIVAMDAVVCFTQAVQWTKEAVLRDITKAHQAFKRFTEFDDEYHSHPCASSALLTNLPEDSGGIATGNWGCGGARISMTITRTRQQCASQLVLDLTYVKRLAVTKA